MEILRNENLNVRIQDNILLPNVRKFARVFIFFDDTYLDGIATRTET